MKECLTIKRNGVGRKDFNILFSCVFQHPQYFYSYKWVENPPSAGNREGEFCYYTWYIRTDAHIHINTVTLLPSPNPKSQVPSPMSQVPTYTTQPIYLSYNIIHRLPLPHHNHIPRLSNIRLFFPPLHHEPLLPLPH